VLWKTGNQFFARNIMILLMVFQVQGVEINWLAPHAFTQNLPTDVDYRVMLTFLEFYETLLKFVNYKLYHNLGLKYPPKLNPNKDKKGSNLMALTLSPFEAAQGQGIESDEDDDISHGSHNSDEINDTQKQSADRLKSLPEKLKGITSAGISIGNNGVLGGGAGEADDAPFEIEEVCGLFLNLFHCLLSRVFAVRFLTCAIYNNARLSKTMRKLCNCNRSKQRMQLLLHANVFLKDFGFTCKERYLCVRWN
jgi:hypothetical protein